jgi:Flp pilus assembly protein TadG
MFPESQPVQSFRKWRKHSEQKAAERFALGWRNTFSAAICALRSGTALAAEVSASLSRLWQTLIKKGKTKSFPQDEKMVSSHLGRHFCLLRGTDAAALIEFAVALPLLVVLIVGIFDFGGAFNLKQELNNAVREGARFGASQPANDLSTPPPTPSVEAIRFLVDSYLQTAKINDCGLSAAAAASGGSLVWTYTASGSGCPGTLTLTINRGNPNALVTPPHPPYPNLQETIGGVTFFVPSTQVWISYPYQWHFNSVIQLLVPGANYTFTNIQSDATAVNMD